MKKRNVEKKKDATKTVAKNKVLTRSEIEEWCIWILVITCSCLMVICFAFYKAYTFDPEVAKSRAFKPKPHIFASSSQKFPSKIILCSLCERWIAFCK